MLSGVSHHSQAASRSRLLRLPRRTAHLAGLRRQLRFLNLLSSAPPCALCVHGTTCFGGCKNQGALTSCLCSLQRRSTASFLAVLKRAWAPKTAVPAHASSKNELKTKVFVQSSAARTKNESFCTVKVQPPIVEKAHISLETNIQTTRFYPLHPMLFISDSDMLFPYSWGNFIP